MPASETSQRNVAAERRGDLLPEVLPAFLRAALQYPRAARMLTGERTSAPTGHEEAEDHNTGVSERRRLHAYLADQPRAAKKFFRLLVRDLRVAGFSSARVFR